MAVKWRCKFCRKSDFETKDAAHACCPEKRAAEAAAKAASAAK